jgi:hypothetical protein
VVKINCPLTTTAVAAASAAISAGVVVEGAAVGMVVAGASVATAVALVASARAAAGAGVLHALLPPLPHFFLPFIYFIFSSTYMYIHYLIKRNWVKYEIKRS